MFSIFFKPNPKESEYKIDFGSHLLPDLDEGAKSLRESIAIIKKMHDMGIQHIITATTVNGNRLAVTPERITESLERLRSAVEKEGIAVTLNAAGCYHLDAQFESLLEERKLLTLPGNRLLIDNSPLVRGTPMHKLLFRIQMAGYKPILAQAEQCTLYRRNLKRIKVLRQCGCDMQVDLLSLQGYRGFSTKLWSHYLVNNGFASFVGSGISSEREARIVAKYLLSGSCRKLLKKANSPLS